MRKEMSGAQKRKLKKLRGELGATVLIAKRIADRKRSEKAYAKNAALIDAIKINRGCADCGYKQHSAALDFDHLPGTKKIDNLSRLRSRRFGSTKCIETEILKCEVVCANCHRIRTFTRRREKRKLQAGSTLFDE